MNTSKENPNDQDPDYVSTVPENENERKIYEENARNQAAQKISAIIEKEFSQEIDTKEKEVLAIQDKLHQALKTLHLLRYVIVTDFYNRKQCQIPQTNDGKQTQIHPAIKQLIGKSPKNYTFNDAIPSTSTDPRFDNSIAVSDISAPTDTDIKSTELAKRLEPEVETTKRHLDDDEVPRPKKIPRYIPPKSSLPEPACPSRGVRHKVRKRIVVGNISKWIPPDWREDAASHKWTMYVRDSKENGDISDFVSKVRFFLHPSYQPNDVVEITSPPFHLSRRGWGEFPLRVQLHFKSPLNKPMDIIHNLKLDRTYTGLQTLGSETVVDVWVHLTETRAVDIDSDIKKENVPSNSIVQNFNDKIANRNTVNSNTNVTNLLGNITIKEEPVDNAEDSCNLNGDEIQTDLNEVIITKEDPIKSEPNFTTDETSSSDEKFEKQINSSNNSILACIQLDHDYVANMNYQCKSIPKENNITIAHTSLPNLRTPSEEANHRLIPIKQESELNKSVPENNKKLVIKNSLLKNNENGTTECSTVQKPIPYQLSPTSNMAPLKITIPSSFEASKCKKILILKNNKLVSSNSNIIISQPIKTTNNMSVKTKKDTNNVKIAPGTSLLKKSQNSLLKSNQKIFLNLNPSNTVTLNTNCSIPALQIVDSANRLPAINGSGVNGHEEKQPKYKTTIGKDKLKICSKRDIYEETLKLIDRVKIDDTLGLIKFIIRRLPLITPDASDPDYKRIHPYAVVSEEKYRNFHVAKQRAHEWNRSKMIQSFLAKKVDKEKLWSAKSIVIWSRLHGYTPFGTFKASPCEDSEGKKNISASSNFTIPLTHAEPTEFLKLIHERSLPPDCGYNENDEEEIDILYDSNKKVPNTRIKEENVNRGSNAIILELDKKLEPLYEFVTETTREIDVRLELEEVVPNVWHCAPARMIMQAVQCLVEDLTRMSLANAFDRNDGNRDPSTIIPEDVFSAMLNRGDFRTFTDDGLGTRIQISSDD